MGPIAHRYDAEFTSLRAVLRSASEIFSKLGYYDHLHLNLFSFFLSFLSFSFLSFFVFL